MTSEETESKERFRGFEHSWSPSIHCMLTRSRGCTSLQLFDDLARSRCSPTNLASALNAARRAHRSTTSASPPRNSTLRPRSLEGKNTVWTSMSGQNWSMALETHARRKDPEKELPTDVLLKADRNV